jgi:Predicted eukaryotic-type DNA primase
MIETILRTMPSPFIELEIGGRVVKVTNPDKVYFPARGETKLDLVQYFVAVGDGIVRACTSARASSSASPPGRAAR